MTDFPMCPHLWEDDGEEVGKEVKGEEAEEEVNQRRSQEQVEGPSLLDSVSLVQFSTLSSFHHLRALDGAQKAIAISVALRGLCCPQKLRLRAVRERPSLGLAPLTSRTSIRHGAHWVPLSILPEGLTSSCLCCCIISEERVPCYLLGSHWW